MKRIPFVGNADGVLGNADGVYGYTMSARFPQKRDDFLLMVHDLRTPTTSVISGMQFMETAGELNEIQNEVLEIALSGAQAVLDMINDLLNVSQDGKRQFEHSNQRSASCFDKFGQVEGQSSSCTSTSLGLTFCKMAIEAHGGGIWIERVMQQGSTFHFVLPFNNITCEDNIEA